MTTSVRLVEAIQKGASMRTVRHDPHCWGIVQDDGRLRANVLGLLTLGECGITRARELLYAFYTERRCNGPATQALLSEFDGIISYDDLEDLIELEELIGLKGVIQALQIGHLDQN